MTTTEELKHWATGHRTLHNNATFIGVFPSDRLPDPQDVAASTPAALIVNYDPHDSPGSHWCSATVMPTMVAWFDSYGLPPDAPDLLLGHTTQFHQWLASVCALLRLPSYSWNAADLQSLGETTCGHYALWFTKHGPKNGWAPFGPDPEANDALIRRIVRLT